MRQKIELVVTCDIQETDDADVVAETAASAVMAGLQHRRPRLESLCDVVTIETERNVSAINRTAEWRALRKDEKA